jgi:hypothetical protein
VKKLAFAAVLSLALVSVANASAGDAGKATGGVKYTTVFGLQAQSDFTAQGTPTDAKGRVHRRVVDSNGNVIRSFEGDVNCYTQDGNVATFSGVITNRQGPDDGLGQYFMWTVQDNGEGNNASPDLIRVDRSPTPLDCSIPKIVPTQAIEEGNIQVH